MHLFHGQQPTRMMPLQPLLLLAATAHGGDADLPPTEPPDLRSKPLVLVKVWCLVIVFVATFLAGVSPYLVKWNDGFILLGSQFAGGVFLGTALMQFLSDSDEIFESLIDKDYPFAFMLASFGYLLAMLSDCIVLYAYHRRRGNDHGRERPTGVLRQGESSSGAGPSQPDIQVDHPTSDLLLLFSAISFGDSVLLLIALCFHAIFEGIGIGMADAKPRAWRALWTVTLHKAFAAMSMGMALLRTIPENPLFSCVAYAFAFAISTPVGVAIGMVMDAATPGVAGAWIYAIFMSLTCGVFVYISVNHLLFKGYYFPKGEVSMDRPPHRFLAAVLGVGVLAIVMIWDTSPRHHAHGVCEASMSSCFGILGAKAIGGAACVAAEPINRSNSIWFMNPRRQGLKHMRRTGHGSGNQSGHVVKAETRSSMPQLLVLSNALEMRTKLSNL